MPSLSIIRAKTLGLFACLLLLPALQKSAFSADKPATPGETLEALKREGAKAYEELERRRGPAKDDAAKKEAVEQCWKEMGALAERAFKIAEEHPGDSAALDAVIWVIDLAGGANLSGKGGEVGKAFDLLTERWITSEKLAPVCYYGHLQSVASPQALHFLEAVSEKSPYRTVRGAAYLGLARHYRDGAKLARRMRDLIMRQTMKRSWAADREFLNRIEQIDCDRYDREAEALFERIVADYADARMPSPYNDTKGVIRYENVRFESMDQAIDRLVGEAEAGADRK